MAAKTLASLLAGTSYEVLRGSADTLVTGISTDSRTTKAGDLFVCLTGYKTEGGETRADRHDFAAAARGATAFLVERPVDVDPSATVIRVGNSWDALATAACAFHEHPSKQLIAVGVTGTSGKTSTTYFIESMLRVAGLSPACLGTIEYRIAGHARPAHQTTPEAPELQRLLREAADAGCRSLVMEVSSHALELRRVGGVAYDVGVFTNLSQDHLNFHPDMEHYLRAKARLFEALGRSGKTSTAVANRDDPACDRMLGFHAGRALTFGFHREADITGRNLDASLRSTRFEATTPRGVLSIEMPHLGDFQAHNALAAVAVGEALDLPLPVIREGIHTAPPIPGRFELVDAGQPFRVIVDYAHKPDALERLLAGARALQPRRLITVFGCGGDRDRSKRPIMGEIASRLSDIVVLTSDNPRTEDPDAILAEIVRGHTGPAQKFVEADRAAAIAMATKMAEPGDIVLVAGKGHETYQLIGGKVLDFDDREVARKALAGQ